MPYTSARFPSDRSQPMEMGTALYHSGKKNHTFNIGGWEVQYGELLGF